MGNIHAFLAVAIVLGFRWPATWAFVLLTKVTPGVGLLWFAVRREWRNLAIALGATAAIVAVSFAIAPSLWAEWIDVLGGRSGASNADLGWSWRSRCGPCSRSPPASSIWAARTDRRWLVPVAAVLAMPVLWPNVLRRRRRRDPAARGEPHRPTGAARRGLSAALAMTTGIRSLAPSVGSGRPVLVRAIRDGLSVAGVLLLIVVLRTGGLARLRLLRLLVGRPGRPVRGEGGLRQLPLRAATRLARRAAQAPARGRSPTGCGSRSCSAVLVWLARDWALAWLAFPPVASELYHGNVHLLIAAALVLSLRHPVAYAFLVSLEGRRPSVTALWWVVRREWRTLAIALGTTAVVVAVSVRVSPSDQWFGRGSPTSRPSRTRRRTSSPIPLVVRLPVAVALVAIVAARVDRAWLLAPAATLALPLLWVHGLAILVAITPLWRLAGSDAVGPARVPRRLAASGPPDPVPRPSGDPAGADRRRRVFVAFQVMGVAAGQPFAAYDVHCLLARRRIRPPVRGDDRQRLRRLRQSLQVPLPAAARPGLRGPPPAAVPARRRAVDRDALRDRARARRPLGAARPPVPADPRRAVPRQRQPAHRPRDRRRVPLAGDLVGRAADEDDAGHRPRLVRLPARVAVARRRAGVHRGRGGGLVRARRRRGGGSSSTR